MSNEAQQGRAPESESGAARGGQRRRVTGVATLLAGIAVGMAVLLGLTAGIGSVWTSVTSTAAAAGTAAAGGGASGQVVNVTIKDVTTPEGSEPAYVGPNGVGAATLFTATAGHSVKVVVDNESSMPHTFTAPSLGLNVSIAPSSTTTFTFTPKSAGSYQYDCQVPCGPYVMSTMGYMEGTVQVVA